MLPSAEKSPIHDLKDSEIETLSSNLVDRMLRTLLLATATNEPFKPQSTSQRNKLTSQGPRAQATFATTNV